MRLQRKVGVRIPAQFRLTSCRTKKNFVVGLGFAKTASGMPITAVQRSAVDGGMQRAEQTATTRRRGWMLHGVCIQHHQNNSTVRLVELYAERTAEQKKRREDMWKDGWRRIAQAGSAHTCLCQYISTSICGWPAAKQRRPTKKKKRMDGQQAAGTASLIDRWMQGPTTATANGHAIRSTDSTAAQAIIYKIN